MICGEILDVLYEVLANRSTLRYGYVHQELSATQYRRCVA